MNLAWGCEEFRAAKKAAVHEMPTRVEQPIVAVDDGVQNALGRVIY